MQHGFVVGNTYPSHRGKFLVLRLEGDRMRIRFGDGREVETTVALQQRIVDNYAEEGEISDDDPPPKTKSAAAPKARRQQAPVVANLGLDFHGLEPDDFKDSVDGTHWRARATLAGLLIKRLHALDPRTVFESYPPYRRPQLYLSLPEKQRKDARLRDAKFFFQINAAQAYYGFYVEKNDGPLDATWDWTRALPALHSPHLQQTVGAAMQRHGLVWVLDQWNPAHNTVTVGHRLVVQGHTPEHPLPPGVKTVTWGDFLDLLHALPADGWADLYLTAELPRDEAVRAKLGIADKAAKVYHDLMPLYLASVR